MEIVSPRSYAVDTRSAKPLLTAAELELFDHSRAEPIKALSAKQLAGKEKRTRALRDKYRDLYRRQSVAVRGFGYRLEGARQRAHATEGGNHAGNAGPV